MGVADFDADKREYLPLLVQPVLVFEAAGGKLTTVRERAERRGAPRRGRRAARAEAPPLTPDS
jgi:hypothetical protein